MDILYNLKRLRTTHKRNVANNDFFTDRLIHRHTTLLISIFVLITTFKKYYYQPINCWIPAELKRYEKYINRFCWLRGTYHAHNLDISLANESSMIDRGTDDHLLKYYQWVPILLLIQAFLFYVPRIVWYFISERILEYNLFEMVNAAIKYDVYGFEREKIFCFLSASLVHPSTRNTSKSELKARRLIKEFLIDAKIPKNQLDWRQIIFNNLLTVSYVFVKMLYLFVACLQLYMMNNFLSSAHDEFYGGEVLSKMWHGYGDLYGEDSRIFPKLTICDMNIRELGTSHHYTIQCILTLNLFNERIYAFLWFWICFLLIPFLVYDLIKWTYILVFYGNHNYSYKHVKTRLSCVLASTSDKKFNRIEKYWLRVFANVYLKPDGVFVLRLIEINSNAIVCNELLKSMWLKFCKNKPKIECDNEIYLNE